MSTPPFTVLGLLKKIRGYLEKITEIEDVRLEDDMRIAKVILQQNSISFTKLLLILEIMIEYSYAIEEIAVEDGKLVLIFERT